LQKKIVQSIKNERFLNFKPQRFLKPLRFKLFTHLHKILVKQRNRFNSFQVIKNYETKKDFQQLLHWLESI